MIGPCNWCKEWNENLDNKGLCKNCSENNISSLIDEIEAINEDKDQHDLKIMPKTDIPIRAYKSADIAVVFNFSIDKLLSGESPDPKTATINSAHFVPCAHRSQIYYADEEAKCVGKRAHSDGAKTPVVACTCGFYAWKHVNMLDEYKNSAKLQVDLSGKIIHADRGYRASHQRVMRVDFPHICTFCPQAAVSLGIGTHSYVQPVCLTHLNDVQYCIGTITPQKLSDLLQTEVIWVPRPIKSALRRKVKSMGPLWLVIGTALALNAIGVISGAEYYFILVATAVLHVPYNAWLTKVGAREYFNLPKGD